MRGIRDRLWWRLRGRVDRLRGGPGEPVEVPDAETFEQVVAVDAAARAWNAPAWVEAAARRLASGHAGLADLVLAACHPNGYIRQAAVTALGGYDDVTALPVLALRAADWVPEVREPARRACAEWLDRAPAEAVTVLAPAALALRDRREGRWLAEAVAQALRTPMALTAALASPDRHTRRLAHTTALAVGRLDVDHLVRVARTDSDLPIRVMCAEAAIRASDDPEVSRRLLGSGTAAVRAEAVRALAAAGEIAPATEALTDRSPLVRATAQTALRRAATDPATRYRTLLTQQPPQPSAVAGLGAQPPEPIADLAAQPPRPSVLAGLGETGTRRDADLLRPWLAHPSSRGRAETVRALRRLGDIPSQLLLPLLTDPVSSVTRQVVLSLIRQPLDEHFLRQLLRDPHPPHVQWAAYRLLRAQGDWTRVSVDLELIGAPDHAAHLAARVDLATWLGHDAATTYSSPKGPRATELATLVTAAEPTLGPHMTRLLRFHLGLS